MDRFGVQEWVVIIAAVGVIVNNAITNWRQSSKIDTVVQTAKVIEGHVNSATTKADERATAGEAREKALQATIEELRRSAALLAQALAIKGASGKAPNIPVLPETPSGGPVSISDVKTLADNLEIKPKEGSK